MANRFYSSSLMYDQNPCRGSSASAGVNRRIDGIGPPAHFDQDADLLSWRPDDARGHCRAAKDNYRPAKDVEIIFCGCMRSEYSKNRQKKQNKNVRVATQSNNPVA